MTAMERMRVFPQAVRELYDDYLRYRNIEDARQSPRNAWNHKLPRRQHQQQVRFLNEIGVALPLIILWIPPIIGYLVPVLAMAAPEHVLAPQFYNAYERKQYDYNNWKRQREYFPQVVQDLRLCLQQRAWSTFWETPMVQATRRLPRPYLESLATAIGVLPTVASIAPTVYLQWYVRRKAIQVAVDNELLLQDDAPSSLTDEEVWEATMVRGLPLGDRHALTEYLQELRPTIESRSLYRRSHEAMGLWALHWAMIRALE